MEMSSTLKTSLILIAACLAASYSFAQRPVRGKPAAKTVEAEVKDSAKQAASLFEAGQNEHQKGDLQKAIELYSEALKRDPDLWQAEYQRGNAYFSLNKLPEAKASITRSKRMSQRVGTMSGKVIRRKSCQPDAPSTLAAS